MKKKNNLKLLTKVVVPIIASIGAIVVAIAACSDSGEEVNFTGNTGPILTNPTVEGDINIEVTSEKEPPITLTPSISYDFEQFVKDEKSMMSAQIHQENNSFYSVPEGYYGDGCLIYFDFTNSSESDIALQKFAFEGSEIEIIDEPYLYAYPDMADPFQSKEIQFNLVNRGWSTATDIVVQLEDSEHQLESFFDIEDRTVRIDSLGSGEWVRGIPIVHFADKKAPVLSPINLELNTRLSFAEGDWYQSDNLLVEMNDQGFDNMDGKGALDYFIPYGMKIPLDNPTCYLEKDLNNLYIPPGEVRRLPFYFFADKTSKMNFTLKFWTSNSKNPLESDNYNIQIFVDPTISQWKAENGDDYKGDPIFEYDSEDLSIFPYVYMDEFIKENGQAS